MSEIKRNERKVETKIEREFDRTGYLTNPLTLTPEYSIKAILANRGRFDPSINTELKQIAIQDSILDDMQLRVNHIQGLLYYMAVTMYQERDNEEVEESKLKRLDDFFTSPYLPSTESFADAVHLMFLQLPIDSPFRVRHVKLYRDVLMKKSDAKTNGWSFSPAFCVNKDYDKHEDEDTWARAEIKKDLKALGPNPETWTAVIGKLWIERPQMLFYIGDNPKLLAPIKLPIKAKDEQALRERYIKAVFGVTGTLPSTFLDFALPEYSTKDENDMRRMIIRGGLNITDVFHQGFYGRKVAIHSRPRVIDEWFLHTGTDDPQRIQETMFLEFRKERVRVLANFRLVEKGEWKPKPKKNSFFVRMPEVVLYMCLDFLLPARFVCGPKLSK